MPKPRLARSCGGQAGPGSDRLTTSASKDGLYRAVLLGPIDEIVAQLAGFDDPALTLTQSLHHLLRGFIGDDDPTAAGQSSESARSPKTACACTCAR